VQTVVRDWNIAKLLLARKLTRPDGDTAAGLRPLAGKERA
jgi:hypothetical protein